MLSTTSEECERFMTTSFSGIFKSLPLKELFKKTSTTLPRESLLPKESNKYTWLY